jgi:Tol biopolymer transport system component
MRGGVMMRFSKRGFCVPIALVLFFLTMLLGACSSNAPTITPTPAPRISGTMKPGGHTTSIAFTCLLPSHSTTICLSSLDGSRLQSFLHLPKGACCPQWSPDGRRMAFLVITDPVDGLGDIWVMNANGSGAVNLTHAPQEVNMDPTWSPDSTQIVFTANVENRSELFLMNADGTQKHLLPLPAGMQAEFPVWSPDGQEIAFVSPLSTTSSAIFLLHLNGAKNVTKVKEFAGYVGPLVWSPDSRHLLYTYGDYQTGGAVSITEVYEINVNGSQQLQLTMTPSEYYASVPTSWSPDGTQILFWRVHHFGPYLQKAEGVIWIMNSDGTDQHQLSLGTQPQDGAVWQP